MSKQCPIQITQAAVNHIHHILSKHQEAIGLRLSAKFSGCSGYRYHLSVVNEVPENDVHIKAAQNVALFIDSQWLSLFAGTTIDLVEKNFGQKQLVFNNPNVEEECGCGESFSLKKTVPSNENDPTEK